MLLNNDGFIYRLNDYFDAIKNEVEYSLSKIDNYDNVIFGGDILYAKALALSSFNLNKGFYACILDNCSDDDLNFLINLNTNIIKIPSSLGVDDASLMADDLALDVSNSYLYKNDNKYAIDFYFNEFGSKIIKECNDLDYFIVSNKNNNLLNGLAKFFLRKTDVKIISYNFNFDLADEAIFGSLDDVLNKYKDFKTLIIL